MQTNANLNYWLPFNFLHRVAWLIPSSSDAFRRLLPVIRNIFFICCISSSLSRVVFLVFCDGFGCLFDKRSVDGRSSGYIQSPEQNSAARSIAFSSSRIFPGQL